MMSKGRVVIFGVVSDGITLHASRKRIGKAKNKKEMAKLLSHINDNDVVMFSSSMDFPREYTTNKTVLALVEKMHAVRMEDE
jgi:hypothetical protein